MARELQPGDPAPDFDLAAGDGTRVSLRGLRGQTVVLYFYPRDNTPGCTREACAFNDARRSYARKNAVVLGVSADSTESHARFAEKYGLSFPLLSDPDKKTLRAYGVWKQKKLYGRTHMGIVRSTFIIDTTGTIVRVFRNVTVDGHADQVAEALP